MGFGFRLAKHWFFAERVAADFWAEIFRPSTTAAGPCTVLRPPKHHVTNEWLKSRVNGWLQDDDVFELAFLRTIIFLRELDGPEVTLSEDCRSLLVTWKSQVSFGVMPIGSLTDGPYYVRDDGFYCVWRLFPDIQEAFVTSTYQPVEGSQVYQPLPCSDGSRLVIGIRSRLHVAPSSPDKPLSGLRASIKDNIDLAGLKTTLSARAWEELYPESSTTAPALQQLIDLGVDVVGKTKMSQFAEVELKTADWVDFHCPFNPRGDGRLVPEGSTAGGAAAQAAYDFLDFSVGTDTGGSLRDPASMQGLFAIRTSWGLLSVDGVFPLATALDTLGFLTRDVDILHKVTSAWISPTAIARSVSNVKTIVVISDFLYGPGPARAVMDNFLNKLEVASQANVTMLSLNRLWKQDDPAGNGGSIAEFVGKQKTMKNLKNFDLWKNTKKFRADYEEEFGRPPSVNPTIHVRWGEGENVTAEEYHAAMGRKKIFQDWFLQTFFPISGSGRLDTIAIAPISEEEPEYRDEYTDGPWRGLGGFHRNFISPLTGCPEVVVPVGQIPYQSRVSKRQEFLPLVVGVLGPPGSDVALTKFMADMLHKAGLATRVMTGTVAFPTDKA